MKPVVRAVRAVLPTLLLACAAPLQAAIPCTDTDLAAERTYSTIEGAQKAGDAGATRDWARVFWQIPGVQACPLARALGEELAKAQLGAKDLSLPQRCPDARTPGGSVTYRKVLDANSRPLLVPEDLIVNGVRYRVIQDPAAARSFSSQDVQQWLADPKSEKLRAMAIDPRLMHQWHKGLVKP